MGMSVSRLEQAQPILGYFNKSPKSTWLLHQKLLSLNLSKAEELEPEPPVRTRQQKGSESEKAT